VLLVVAGTHGGDLALRAFPALMCVLVGVMYLSKPYFTLEADRVVIKALIGPVQRVHRFAARSEVRVENGVLWVGSTKTGIRRWLADKGDWEKLEQSLAAR
jgi:hypothetical protein